MFFNYHRDLNRLDSEQKVIKKTYGVARVKRSKELHISFSNLDDDSRIVLTNGKGKKIN